MERTWSDTPRRGKRDKSKYSLIFAFCRSFPLFVPIWDDGALMSALWAMEWKASAHLALNQEQRLEVRGVKGQQETSKTEARSTQKYAHLKIPAPRKAKLDKCHITSCCCPQEWTALSELFHNSCPHPPDSEGQLSEARYCCHGNYSDIMYWGKHPLLHNFPYCELVFSCNCINLIRSA